MAVPRKDRPIDSNAGSRAAGVLLGCVRAALMVTILAFALGVSEGFEPIKIAIVRIIGLGLLGVALLAWPRLRERDWGLTDAAVLLWLVVEAAATATSRAPWISWFGDHSQREGLLTSLSLVGLYLGARLGTRSLEDAKATLGVALTAIALSCAYALVQAAGLDPIDWSRAATFGPGETRPAGTLGHPNLLGVVSGAAAVGAVALAWVEPRRRWLPGLGSALFGLVTLLTLSRAAWLGLGAGVILALMLLVVTGARPLVSARGVGLGVATLVVMAGALVLSPWGRLVSARLGELFSSGGSAASRLEIWRAATRMWWTRPVLGQGPDTFAMLFPTYQTDLYWRLEWGRIASHAHSIYLHSLATRGILGLLAGGMLAASLARAAWLAGRAGPDAPALVAGLVGMTATVCVAGAFGAIGISGALLLVVIAALLAFLAGRTAGTLPPHRRQSAAPRSLPAEKPRLAIARWAWLAGALLAVLAAGWGALDFAAARAAFMARSWLFQWAGAAHSPDERDALRALAVTESRWAEQAMGHDDGYSLLHSQTALAAALALGRPAQLLDEAETAARRAAALAPLRPANHQQLASVLTVRSASGGTAIQEAASSAWRRCRELAPRDGTTWLRSARAELMWRRPERARSLAQRGTELYPRDGPLLYALALAQDALGDSSGFREALRRSVAGEWHGDPERARAVTALQGEP